MRLVAMLVVVLVVAGCSGATELVVTVKTDFAPETEFATVRTALHDAAAQTATRAAASGDAFLEGVRVASFPTANGTASLTVDLLDAAGVVVMSRDVQVEVRGSTVVTVLITRTCTSVHCPGAGDPANATSCEAGRCVSPSCTSGCIGATCSAPTDCPAMSTCVAPQCDHGLCLYPPAVLGHACTMTFCPEAGTLRQQAAVFIVRLMHGATFAPPAATGVFSDVPASSAFAPYVEQLARDGITAGCGTDTFCPAAEVLRWQAATFLVRSMHGATFVPPAATGMFADVPVTEAYATFVEQLVRDGITSGCGGGNFCPEAPFVRRQAAVYVLKAEHGATFSPPAATGAFLDVPASLPEAPFVEQFVTEGFAVGCVM